MADAPSGRLAAALGEGRTTVQELAARLGVKDDRVREGLWALREAGFSFDCGDNGVRVTAVPEYGLGVAYGLAAPFDIEYHESIGSTNDRARELAADGATDVVVLADVQTGGRGRLDRAWTSPPGGVWLSVLLRPALSPRRVSVLTLAAAVSVVRAVRPYHVDATIKWPNDVLSGDGRKLAGVLTESATADGAVAWTIVGIGVNANVDAADLPDGATSLRELVGDVDRVRFTRRLLESFHGLRTDPDGALDAWREHAITLGRRVGVETGTRTIAGEAVAVDDAGALVVDTGAETVRVAAGDCEHLRPE